MTVPDIRLPADLLPADGRFGAGPSKVRPESVDALAAAAASYLGTSHRAKTVRSMVGRLRSGLSDLFRLPDGYEVALGNGGAALFWDMATFGLIERRSQHLTFGQFSASFAAAARAAPFLDDPDVIESAPGTHPSPRADPDVDAYAFTHNETSTGVVMPIRRPAGSVEGSLVLVDATSAAGGMRVDPAEFDAYYFAPQKCFAADGGLWLALLSPAAVERVERIKAPRNGMAGRWTPALLDLGLALENSRLDQTYNTPGLATIFLMVEQVEWMLAGGGLGWAASRSEASAAALYPWAEASEYATPFVADPAQRSPVVGTIDLAGSVDANVVSAVLRANGIVDTESYRRLGRNQLRIAMYPAVEASDVAVLTQAIDHVVAELPHTTLIVRWSGDHPGDRQSGHANETNRRNHRRSGAGRGRRSRRGGVGRPRPRRARPRSPGSGQGVRAGGQGGQTRRRPGRHPGGGHALPGGGRHQRARPHPRAAGSPRRPADVRTGGQGRQPRRRPPRAPGRGQGLPGRGRDHPRCRPGAPAPVPGRRPGGQPRRRPLHPPAHRPGVHDQRRLNSRGHLVRGRRRARRVCNYVGYTDVTAHPVASLLQFRRRSADDRQVDLHPATDLAALYRELQPGLLRYLRAVAGGSAEDLAADVWVEVAASAHRFQGDQSAFRGWLFTIARRRVIDSQRRAGRRRTDPVARERLAGFSGNDHPDQVVLDRATTEAAVAYVLAVLSPDQAEVVLLRVIGGLRVSQVAELLNKRPGTVRVLQHRGLRRLADHSPRESLSA